MRFADFWRWDGKAGRGVYALWGFVLFAAKLNIDRAVAAWGFDRPWGITHYWSAEGRLLPQALGRTEDLFYWTLLALAVPFIWVGTALTLQRLRDAGLRPWLVALFFVPFVNLILFALLCVLPSLEEGERLPGRSSLLDRWVPRGRAGSAAFAVLLTLAFGLPVVWLGTSALKDYGWGLFVGLPFCQGLAAALLHGHHERRSLRESLGVASLSITLLGLAIFAAAVEGIICLLMALPIAWVLASLGACAGWAIQDRRWKGGGTGTALLVAILAAPALMGAQRAVSPPPPLFAVRTEIDIDAPSERVWEHVVSFAELPPPEHWLFKLGVAHPIRAEIEGTGPGAVRRCVFSTGAFVEPIEVWDAPRLLRFSVVSQPPPMKELTPYVDVHPPHLDGFLVSKGGQFLLTPLPGGRTRLEGTTWYHHRMWPAQYWRVWSDLIIHRIHLRVLSHIRERAEAPRD